MKGSGRRHKKLQPPAAKRRGMDMGDGMGTLFAQAKGGGGREAGGERCLRYIHRDIFFVDLAKQWLSVLIILL